MDTKKNHFFHFLITHALYLLFIIPLLGVLSAHYFFTLKLNLAPVLACTSFLVFLGTFYSKNKPRNVYLLDFACYKPKPELMGSTERYIERSRQINIFTEESLSFQKKVLERSGLGQKTYIPESIMGVNAKPSLDEVRKDAEAAIFGCIDEVLDKTGVKSEDVGIVVVNSSVFDPAPSLSAMIVRRYKLVSTVKSFNLGGMGCSAGLISIDLAKHLLQASPNCYALVVSTEIQSLNWVPESSSCLIMSSMCLQVKPYIPDFKLAFEHFCIHAGGKAVLDAIEKNLELSEWHMEPSRMTLYRFGNTSSSSLWYELAYTEAKGRIRKGDRTWQIAFGSGFKCNSAVWRALKNINPAMEKNPWMDEIHEFPVDNSSKI
nr:3-ketoacyl-CoA synthase 20-like [Ipomoea batatas]